MIKLDDKELLIRTICTRKSLDQKKVTTLLLTNLNWQYGETVLFLSQSFGIGQFSNHLFVDWLFHFFGLE